MALARTRSVTLEGVRGTVIEVEVHIGPGLPRVVLVGLPDAALNESRDRCRAAVINSGQTWPNRNLTIGLSPASVPKAGAIYDLAIALGVLAADGTIPAEPLADAVLLGELALDGRLRAVPGVLPATLAAVEAGCTRVMVPEVNAAEAEAVEGASVVGLRSLGQAVALFTGDPPPDDPPVPPLSYSSRVIWSGQDRTRGLDLAEVLGQAEARWCVEVAAAGGHHLLLEGPPGAGKTMLAERLPGLLPDLDLDESLEVSAVHSIAGTLPPDGTLLTRPPFLDPHHTASVVSIVGGGSRVIRPGAMSLAHRGVLFMDEAPEFDARVLEGLRQPLESGQISIGRSERTATFPSQFQLVLAANPCPCGYDWGRDARCECSPAGRRRYRGKISGPIRDRIDIYRRVHPVQRHDLRDDLAFVETSVTVAARANEARARQAARLAGTPWRRNAEIPGTMLRTQWPVRAGRVRELEAELAGGRISARGVDRVLRLSWTLADLAERAEPNDDDVATAMGLRSSGLLPVARTRAREGAA